MYVQEASDMKAWLQKNEKINIWKTEAVKIRDTLRNRKYRVQVAIVAGLLAVSLFRSAVSGRTAPRCSGMVGKVCIHSFVFRRQIRSQRFPSGLRKPLRGGNMINSPDGRRAFRAILFKKWRYIYDR